MPRGGKRNGAGRPRGSLSQKTTQIACEAAARGLTPLEVMLEAMTYYHDAGDREKAAAIAKDAAPYVHPRLSAMAVNLNGETPRRLAIVEEIVVQGALPDHVNGDGSDAHPNREAAQSPAGVPQE